MTDWTWHTTARNSFRNWFSESFEFVSGAIELIAIAPAHSVHLAGARLRHDSECATLLPDAAHSPDRPSGLAVVNHL